MQPAGVQGSTLGVPFSRAPAFMRWKPSTSFFQSTAARASSSFRCLGSGSWISRP